MTDSLCGEPVTSRRGMLASLWSLVTLLTLVAFVVALIFSHSKYNADDDNYYYQKDEMEEGGRDAEIAVTSRAMAFAALWTAVLAAMLSIFGTVVLGWQSPTGIYYTCCAPQVHRTSPLALGSFIGAVLMFANFTLVCSVLFGEFEVSITVRGWNVATYLVSRCVVMFYHCDCCFCVHLMVDVCIVPHKLSLTLFTRFGITGTPKTTVKATIDTTRKNLWWIAHPWPLASCVCF